MGMDKKEWEKRKREWYKRIEATREDTRERLAKTKGDIPDVDEEDMEIFEELTEEYKKKRQEEEG